MPMNQESRSEEQHNAVEQDDKTTEPAFGSHALYSGTVVHLRTRPVRHHLSYRVFSLFLDIDALPTLNTIRTGLIGYNRKALVQVKDSDHGPRTGKPLRPWINAILRNKGYDCLVDQPVRLLCFPRLWGYAFNPLSMYYCYNDKGTLGAVLYHVANTFGESHCYLLPVDDTQPAGNPVRHCTDKVFHVSPFMQMDCRYQFNFKPPGKKLAFQIAEFDHQNKPLLYANHMGVQESLTSKALIRALVKNPALSHKIIVGIHWEAFKLWMKGVPFFPKPIKPQSDVT